MERSEIITAGTIGHTATSGKSCIDFKYSVLMPVSKKENPVYFRESLNSVIEQTIAPNEIVLVKEGKFTSELEGIVTEFIRTYPGLFRIVEFEENKGHGNALSLGVLACRNEWIAGMDSDDISCPNRIEEQLKVLRAHPELDMITSAYYEFKNNNMDEAVLRTTPEHQQDLERYLHRSNPFEHDTVLIRKEKVVQAGNYRGMHSFEDYDLWIRIFKIGINVYNLQKPLVYVRTKKTKYPSKDRWNFFKKHMLFMRSHKDFFNLGQRLYTTLLLFIACLSTRKLRTWIFTATFREIYRIY